MREPSERVRGREENRVIEIEEYDERRKKKTERRMRIKKPVRASGENKDLGGKRMSG